MSLTFRTLASEIVDEIRALRSEETGLLGAVVNVDLAVSALPAGGAAAHVAALMGRKLRWSRVIALVFDIALRWALCKLRHEVK